MRKIKISVILFLLIFTGQLYSQNNPVYIGMVDSWKNIILEDHVTRTRNNEKNKENPEYYESYTKSFVNLLKKEGKYSESRSEYFFSNYVTDFGRYTDIKIGDLFYLSTSAGTYSVKVTGYKILLDDEIGGGNIFYVVTENPEPGKFREGEMCIASKYTEMKSIDTTGTSDIAIYDKLKNIIAKLTISGKKQPDEDTPPFESLKIYEGKYVDDLRMMPRTAKQYLVSYVKRTSFDSYTSLISVYDDEGILLKELSPVLIDNFEFRNVLGVTDINNDGYFEILTEWGYYEGWGSELYGYNGTDFIIIADGFFFGV